ncbi:MAG TPA: hypothetical protein VFB60_24690 [Ktedonobacteraceae bacterium]|nr:hypothetical protein [Ktedonobacteraceae bacterium]
MLARNANRNHYVIRLLVLSLLAILLFSLLVSCGAGEGARKGTPLPVKGATTSTQAGQVSATQPVPTSAPLSPTSTAQPSILHGPTNFLLTTPLAFSSASGATMDNNGAITPLDANTIKTQITAELKRLLFVVDSRDDVKVYSPGTSPVTAQVTQQADSSIALDYQQTVDSEAGSVTITFDGVLLKDRMTVTYDQQYSPSILINANASEVTVALTAAVRWVSADQIPAAPGNGRYQLISNGGVALAWSAGQNAAAYNIYRLISDRDQQFQLLATVKATTYTDNSAAAAQYVNSPKGITYAIFSVGPTGVENPGGMVIVVATQ